MSELSERDVRASVYGLDLKPNTKLTLLGVLHRVSWQSWAGNVSAKSIAEAMSLNERSVKRALKELIELGLIERQSQLTESGRNASAVTIINVSLVMGDIVTPSGCHSDTKDSDSVTPYVGGNMSPLTTQPREQPIEQPREQPKAIAQSVWDMPTLASSTPVTNRRGYR